MGLPIALIIPALLAWARQPTAFGVARGLFTIGLLVAVLLAAFANNANRSRELWSRLVPERRWWCNVALFMYLISAFALSIFYTGWLIGQAPRF